MVNTDKLLNKVKAELRIETDADDGRLRGLIVEALAQLQMFKAKTLVDVVADSASETSMSPLDDRFVYIYVALYYDGDQELQPALDRLLAFVRDGR